MLVGQINGLTVVLNVLLSSLVSLRESLPPVPLR